MDTGDDRVVAIDDLVEDRVEHSFGPATQDVRLPLQSVAHRTELRRFAVTNGQDEARTDEHVDLAELDLLDVVHVAGGPKHHEEGLVVTFDLRPLMSVDRVLDGEGMELELGGQRLDLLLLRSVQADPGHPVGVPAQALERLRQRSGGGDSFAVNVDRTVDQPRTQTVPRRSLGYRQAVVAVGLVTLAARPSAYEGTDRRPAVLGWAHSQRVTGHIGALDEVGRNA